MRKWGIFSFFAFLMAMMVTSVVGDEGDAGDFGDFDIGDEGTGGENENSVSVPKTEWENVQRSVETYEQERFFNDTMKTISAEIPGFDHTKVVERLKEIHKEDPAKAAQYNSPVGFKLLWHEMSAKVAQDDAVNNGMSKGGSNDFHAAFDGAMKGDPKSLQHAIAMAQ